MNLLVSSTHPARAGLQVALADTLIDFGAAIDGVQDDESPLLTALAFHYPAAADRLATRGARVDTIVSAAGLGREDVVREMIDTHGQLSGDVPLPPLETFHVSRDRKAHIDLALVWAAALGQAGVVDVLSERGVELGAVDHQGFTALHWAAFQGHLDVVDVLLRHRAPLEKQNIYGGTVLSTTVWAATHVDGVFHGATFTRVDYAPVVERLLKAGARPDVVQIPTGNGSIDALLGFRR